MGCHSGLSVSDITIGRTNQDWAQTLGRQGSLYIGNTGFGYGDTETVAYTEQLMALFADLVTSPLDLDPGDGPAVEHGRPGTRVGEEPVRLRGPELQRLRREGPDGVDVLRSALLPHRRCQQPPSRYRPHPSIRPSRRRTGLETLPVVADVDVITNEAVPTGDSGTYFRNVDADGNEQVIVAPGRPIQPKTVTDISVVGSDTTELAQVARGAVITGMTSTYVDVPNPVIATPVFDEGINQPEPEPLPAVFPLKPLEIVTTTGPPAHAGALVQATGQYRGATGVQRLDDDIETVVYYAAPRRHRRDGADDRRGHLHGRWGQAPGDAQSGQAATPDLVKRVVVLVAQDPAVGPPSLQSFDLQRRAGTNVWDGEFDLDPTTSVVEFRVQAVDQAGNVGYASNKTEGYPATVASDPVVTGVWSSSPPRRRPGRWRRGDRRIHRSHGCLRCLRRRVRLG